MIKLKFNTNGIQTDTTNCFATIRDKNITYDKNKAKPNSLGMLFIGHLSKNVASLETWNITT